MDDLLLHILKQIVTKPEDLDILVDESQTSNFVTLIIDSAEEDVPLIIGRKGRTIKALRSIVGIKALQEQKRLRIEIKNEKPRDFMPGYSSDEMQSEPDDRIDSSEVLGF